MSRYASRAALFAALLLAGVVPVSAQEHKHPAPADSARDAPAGERSDTSAMRSGPIGEPRNRESSGTAWLPDASPMHALHGEIDGWELMLHGSLYVHWFDDGGDRGRSQFGSTNWAMGMARRPVLGGDLTLRAMLSADPLTADECGYPDLLATGEFCDGEPLHDRQHPHDVFMELAAVYERAIAESVAVQLYAGPVGEPAIGPVAFPHRISSFPNPIAPIGHHWLDSTHIAFGVVSGGIYGREWKAEASFFNGREPDEERFDLDLDALDSYAARFWFLPSDRWALQASAARLNEAEVHESGGPRIDLTRVTASATYHRPLAGRGLWASTLAWGRNREDGDASHAFLVETELNMAERDLVYGRLEVVEKTGHDLVLPDDLEKRRFTVGKLGVGYLRQLSPWGAMAPGVGIGVTLSRVPAGLEAFYGARNSTGLQLFFRVRPVPMDAHPH